MRSYCIRKLNHFVMLKNLDWSRELWYVLFFVCLGFTVWPLMIYYLGQSVGLSYFIDLPLRTWAEEKVYGPLSFFNFRAVGSLLLLLTPFIAANILRILLYLVRK